MGQQANNHGRHAALDEKKSRAAGRRKNPAQSSERDFDVPFVGRGRVKGAFGNSGRDQKPSKSGRGGRS